MDHNTLLAILICMVLIILYCHKQQEEGFIVPRMSIRMPRMPRMPRMSTDALQQLDNATDTSNPMAGIGSSIARAARRTATAIRGTADQVRDTSNTLVDTNPQASADGTDVGTCYRPEMTNDNAVHELDSCFINQMGKVEDADDYIYVVNNIRKRYKDVLMNTVDNVYGMQDEISNSLNDVQNDFNKYGLETLSRQYYDTIYQHGNFAEVKDRIVLDPKLSMVNGEIVENEPTNNTGKNTNNSANNTNTGNNTNIVNTEAL